MFVHRTALVSVLACFALLVATSAPAVADDHWRHSQSQIGDAPLTQEQYYSSYGEPDPLTVSQSPAPSDDTPWPTIALTVAALLAIVASVVAIRHRRHRVRRHAPQVAA